MINVLVLGARAAALSHEEILAKVRAAYRRIHASKEVHSIISAKRDWFDSHCGQRLIHVKVLVLPKQHTKDETASDMCREHPERGWDVTICQCPTCPYSHVDVPWTS